MIKTEQLNKLFLGWKEANASYKTSFSEDGIINEELWNKAGSKRQILFLFKERNKDGGERDFRKLLNEDKNPWPTVGYWSYGLQNITDLPRFEEAVKNSKDACRSSAIVNLKKVSAKIIGQTITPHYFRHRVCTVAGNNKVNMADVQAITGIKDVKVLIVYYQHETVEGKEKILALSRLK